MSNQTAHSEHNDITEENLVLMLEVAALNPDPFGSKAHEAMNEYWVDTESTVEDLRMKPGTPFDAYFEWLYSWLDFSRHHLHRRDSPTIIRDSLIEWKKANPQNGIVDPTQTAHSEHFQEKQDASKDK